VGSEMCIRDSLKAAECLIIWISDSSAVPPVPARLNQVGHLHPLELLRHPLL
jgi:hypothetical protein